MKKDNNLNPENEIQAQTPEIETVEENTKKVKKEKKDKKPKKQKLLKNQAFLKRGSYSLAITAAFIAGAIIINILVGALSDRFVLEFDMSTEKINTINEDNLKYIKSVKDKVEIIVCSEAENYVSEMAFLAQQANLVSNSEYFEQTLKLVERYGDYNKNISIRYIDSQTTEFAEIAQKYPDDELTFGDIVVSCTKNGNERHKKLSFIDIYNIYQDESSYTIMIDSNNIETALTSAIAYATSSETKKFAVISNHSNKDYTANYVSLLKQNNYEVDVIENNISNEISNEYDALIIAAPTKDFNSTELDAISDFLENDGKLEKGLIFFADVTAPYLTNLYDFLAQWGIVVEEGIVYETNDENHLPDMPTALASSISEAESDITSELPYQFVTDYNAPLSAAFETKDNITVTSLAETFGDTVIAPLESIKDWTGSGDATPATYSTLIQAEKSTYNDDNKKIASYVLAFSSIDFLTCPYDGIYYNSNKELTFNAAESAVNAEDIGIIFDSRYIETQNFTVSESSARTVQIVFMYLFPLVMIALGIFVYIKRRNS